MYCRPSCAARPARPENVRFHVTRADAEAAGFRACKRCKPDLAPLAEQHADARSPGLCRMIENAERRRLEALAKHGGPERRIISIACSRRSTGVTPKGYAAAHRARRVRAGLERSGTVTEAIYDAGYNSNGRFYAKSDECWA